DVYRARLSAAGTEILNGTFGVPEGIAGVWSATQAIPATFRLVSATEIEVCWQTVTGLSYRLETKTGLAEGDWTPVEGAPTTGSGESGESVCQQLTLATDETARFYRIVIAP
ncbi:MAG: hypothetical protein KIT22_08365, partial [Verrucomicrobiae bacterium]|nr:hypothetical protein [Verrucomicrobiae bacterium]